MVTGRDTGGHPLCLDSHHNSGWELCVRLLPAVAESVAALRVRAFSVLRVLRCIGRSVLLQERMHCFTVTVCNGRFEFSCVNAVLLHLCDHLLHPVSYTHLTLPTN